MSWHICLIIIIIITIGSTIDLCKSVLAIDRDPNWIFLPHSKMNSFGKFMGLWLICIISPIGFLIRILYWITHVGTKTK